MNVRQRYKKLRVRRKAALQRFPLPPLLAAGMAAGYVIGCCCGANAELTDSSGPVLSFLQSGGAGDTLYGGLLPELCISCAYGAVFARRALRADVCASDGAAARTAVSCCDGALFPGTGVGVLPAACGCGHGELCRAVFHKAYSVTDGHSG